MALLRRAFRICIYIQFPSSSPDLFLMYLIRFLKVRTSAGVPNTYNAYVVGFYSVIYVVREFA